MKKIPTKFNMRALLYNKKFTVTVSIILSVVIWFVILINRNPTRERTFRDMTAEVNISQALKDMGLDLASDPTAQKFEVKVSGPNYVVSSLKPEDIKLITSVSDITESGKYRLAVAGASNSNKIGYEFVSVSPQTIEVTVDNFDTNEFDIETNIVGVSTPANKNLIAETPVISEVNNRKISIRGPRSVVKKIATVQAYYEVNKILSSTETFNCEIRLIDTNGLLMYRYSTDGKIYDSNGKIILKNYLDMEFETVNVTQQISKEKVLNVAAKFTNVPSTFDKDRLNKNGDFWSCESISVKVKGTPSVIDSMDELALSPIDFRDIHQSNRTYGVSAANSFEVSAALPDGVALSGENDTDVFKVKINLNGYRYYKSSILASNIEFDNVPSGYTATASDITSLEVCGDAQFFAFWQKSANRKIVIDLKGFSATKHNIENKPIITLKTSNTAWICGDYSVTVNITKKK